MPHLFSRSMKAKSKENKLIHLQRKINYFFKNPSLLNRALTHKSFANEVGEPENEKLEFLGDAIIGMLVSEYLYTRFPRYSEGRMSTIKSAVVSRPTLARKAGDIELGSYLLLGKGEEGSDGRKRPSILANAFEAVVAAIYLDSSLEQCRPFVVKQLEGEIEKISSRGFGKDHKGMLQEYAQSEYGFIPDYHVISTEGPEHKKFFEVTVSLKRIVWGRGKGASKKEAEKAAAKNAWEYILGFSGKLDENNFASNKRLRKRPGYRRA